MSEPIYFSIVDRNSWKTCVCVWEACETTRFNRKMDSIAEKG